MKRMKTRSKPTHKEDCRCIICIRERGELPRTKGRLSITLNIGLLTHLRKRASEDNIGLSEFIEGAVKDKLKASETFLNDLDNAPLDDEPLSQEELEAIEQGKKDIIAGRTIPIEKVMKQYGI